MEIIEDKETLLTASPIKKPKKYVKKPKKMPLEYNLKCETCGLNFISQIYLIYHQSNCHTENFNYKTIFPIISHSTYHETSIEEIDVLVNGITIKPLNKEKLKEDFWVLNPGGLTSALDILYTKDVDIIAVIVNYDFKSEIQIWFNTEKMFTYMYTLYVENTHISQIHFYPNCDFDYYIFSLVTDEEIIISNCSINFHSALLVPQFKIKKLFSSFSWIPFSHNRFLAGEINGGINLYLIEGEEIDHLQQYRSMFSYYAIDAIDASFCSTLFACGDRSGRLYIYSYESVNPIMDIYISSFPIINIMYTIDSEILAVTTNVIYSINYKRIKPTFLYYQGTYIYDSCVSPNIKSIVTCSDMGLIFRFPVNLQRKSHVPYYSNGISIVESKIELENDEEFYPFYFNENMEISPKIKAVKFINYPLYADQRNSLYFYSLSSIKAKCGRNFIMFASNNGAVFVNYTKF